MAVNNILCLGDSYTIGEGVPLHENFPYQLVQILRNNGLPISAPEIIAKTGWTTFELKDQITHTTFLEHYNYVTLLIGVNNQYRKLPVEEYITDFEWLLNKAIQLADNNKKHVIVLSIPDWGVTPFAEGREREKISTEIDEYNSLNKSTALQMGVHYINITYSTREAVTDDSLLAYDKLHYSAKEHRKWADLIAGIILQ